jgi:chromosome segregation ATPase
MDLQNQIETITKERDQIKEQHRNIKMALQECRLNRTTRNLLIKNLMAEVKDLKKKVEVLEKDLEEAYQDLENASHY